MLAGKPGQRAKGPAGSGRPEEGRPPPPDRKHTAALNMRLQPDQLDLFHRAADRSGLSVSGWVRERLLRAAQEELGEDGV